MILLLKRVALPPHAVVSATCPEGKQKGEEVNAS